MYDVRTCDGVQASTRLQQVRVLREQNVTDDTSSVVLHFEMRIGKADEDLFHLVLAKEVGQVSHAVCSV